MSIMALNLPTDIRWERVCVSEDMIDPEACDSDTPPKWQTSMALYRYVPEDEYQVYGGRRIIYYKLLATITSYQPEDQEIEGMIDWARVHPQDIGDFQERLKTFLPCNGAMIQVTVTPPRADSSKLLEYPYILDCQPKQRMLYEQATDTNERVSRSLEGLTVRKGAGTTDSLEVLDVDEGKSLGGNVSVLGTGLGFNYADKGQSGSKRLARGEVSDVRTTDSSREARETQSHATQLTQMYNLFQTYHLGTNRLMCYIAPRPHVLEEPSGFIRGPRMIDGMQEVFFIVSQPKDQGDPCIGIRIDTAHLTLEDIFDYDRGVQPQEIPINLDVPPPEKDAPDKLAAEGGGEFYDCYDLKRSDVQTATAPVGYLIESVDVLKNDAKNSDGGHYEISPDSRSITVQGETFGHRCFRNGAGNAANDAALAAAGAAVGGFLGAAVGFGIGVFGGNAPGFPDTKSDSPGFLHYLVRINFRSMERTKKVGEQWVLKVTSRGLCCCHRLELKRPWHPRIVAVQDFPMTTLIGDRYHEDQSSAGGHTFNAREINLVQDKITEMAKRVSSAIARPGEIRGMDLAYMMSKLINAAAATPTRQRLLRTRLHEFPGIAPSQARKFAELIGKPAEAVTRYDLATAPDAVVRHATGIDDHAELTKLRLTMLGFPMKNGGPREKKPTT
jgi:hypothetical protein